MRSYGRIDPSWDESKFKKILEDASNMAKKHGMSLRIGEDKNGNVIISPNIRDSNIHIFACGITKRSIDKLNKDLSQAEIDKILKEEFWDNLDFHSYTIDEMIPRVYDCLVNGIIRYGHLGFLSEGQYQLHDAENDARKLMKKHSRPFIVGQRKSKDEGIMIAPLSEKEKFFEPLAYMIAKSGFWGISDRCSYRIRGHSVYLLLYNGIADGKKSYDWFEYDKDHCILNLERAFEDAVKMSRYRNVPYLIKYNYGQINIKPNEDHVIDKSIEINPKEFLDGDLLLHEIISIAAKKAYEKFLTN